jgi:hypothetical protein
MDHIEKLVITDPAAVSVIADATGRRYPAPPGSPYLGHITGRGSYLVAVP